MTCRRSTVGRVRTARQGLRITAGSDWDEHTIRGKATRAYLPFHDRCHHLRVPSTAPPPRWEGFLAALESFSCLLQEKFWRKLAAPHKGTHESHREGVKQKWEVRRCQPGREEQNQTDGGWDISATGHRIRWNNAQICRGAASEHVQALNSALFSITSCSFLSFSLN